MSRRPRCSAVLLVAFLAPVAAAAETWLMDAQSEASFETHEVKPGEKQQPPEELLQQRVGEKPAEKGPWGVLLGVSTEKHTLETWFVTANEVSRLGAGLAVPRRDGWWFVDLVGDNVLMRPAGKVTKKDFVPLLQDDDSCADGKRQGYTASLLYAGPDIVTYESDHWTEYCTGAWDAIHERGISTLPFPDRKNASASIGSVLGPEAQAAWDAATKKACGEDGCPTNDVHLPGPSWGLTPLRVFAVIPYMGGTAAASIAYVKVPLAGKLLAGLKRPSLHFVADARHPLPPLGSGVGEPGQAYATITAPDGSFELRFYDDMIIVWAGRIVGSIPEKDVRLVMEEWASGAPNMTRWKKQASSLLEKVPRPRK